MENDERDLGSWMTKMNGSPETDGDDGINASLKAAVLEALEGMVHGSDNPLQVLESIALDMFSFLQGAHTASYLDHENNSPDFYTVFGEVFQILWEKFGGNADQCSAFLLDIRKTN